MARIPAASNRATGVAERAGYGTALLACSVALPLLLLVRRGLKEQ